MPAEKRSKRVEFKGFLNIFYSSVSRARIDVSYRGRGCQLRQGNQGLVLKIDT